MMSPSIHSSWSRCPDWPSRCEPQHMALGHSPGFVTLQPGELGHWQCWAGAPSITALPRSSQPKLNHVCRFTRQPHLLLQIKGKPLGTEVTRQELSLAYRHSQHPQSLQGRHPCPWTSSHQKFMNIAGATFMPTMGLQRLRGTGKLRFAMENLSLAKTA